jgi:hypothetical protein
MRRELVAVAVLTVFAACQKDAVAVPAPPPTAPVAVAKPDQAQLIQAAELAAVARDERPKCEHPVSIYAGSINVDSSGYTHLVPKGDDYVEAAIKGLDRTVSSAPQLRFTLDYPFEKPLSGAVAGKLTLRRIIDAIRAGFRKMYGHATVNDIPGMMNKDVRGPYGSSFHDIGDLVIEGIDLCDGDWLDISIGS